MYYNKSIKDIFSSFKFEDIQVESSSNLNDKTYE